MSSKAMKYREYLNLLSKSKSKKRRNLLIDYGNKNEITAILEIITNLLHGNIPLSEKQKSMLSKYKRALRKIAKKCSMKKKKDLLKQHGGFLGAVIPLALGLLGNIFGSR